MSEKIAQREEELSAAASDVSIWRSLMEHPGWVKMEQILLEQRNARIGVVALSPLESLAKLPAQEFMKGEANAYGATAALPANMLEAAKAAFTMREVQLQQEKDHAVQTASAGSGSRVDDEHFSRE